jgi:TolB-like protein
MAIGDGVVADLAGAILDGGPIDWSSVDSSVTPEERALVHQLKLLAGLADVHRTGGHPAPRRWAHLDLIEPIGTGAHGVVHRAWDSRLDREVALKLLPAPAGAGHAHTIIEEGRLLARVRHPNVATIFGADLVDGWIGLWMELVPGHTLEQLLQQGRRFAAGEVARIGVDLCGAMAAVHAAGVLHRDIKAHNVMLADDGRIVLMDFGTGRELEDESLGRVAGTPLYLAPEIFGGEPASVRSDVYSAGVLLHRLATGDYPVTGQSVDELRLAHAARRPTAAGPLRQLPAGLARVIGKCIHPDAEQRYGSAEDMAHDLDRTRRPASRVLAYAVAGVLLIAGAWLMAGLLAPGSSTASPTTGRHAGTVARIAVLPLQNLDPAPDSEYFADGLTDEVIRNLTVIEGLDVRSRTSSFALKGGARNLKEVGAQLGVDYVVEGSVLRAGSRLRVNAQLIRIADDSPLWSERYDRELSDVFAVQEEISRNIVNRLRLSVGQGRRRYETNVALYDQYLKARARLETREIGRRATDTAAMFDEIVEADPAFAPAQAGLATALAYASMSPYSLASDAEGLARRLRDAAQRALDLDPLLPEAHAAMGWAHARDFEWAEAERAYVRALELAPSMTTTAINFSYSTLRPLEKLGVAESVLRDALVVDPLSFDLGRELVSVLMQAGRPAEVMAEARRLRPGGTVLEDVRLGRDYLRAHVLSGRSEEALRLASAAGGRFMQPGSSHWLATALVLTGRREQAETMARQEQDFPFRLMFIHAALGNRTAALDALERMRAAEPQRVALAMVQPELAMLRGDPRWHAVRRSLRVPEPSPLEPRP